MKNAVITVFSVFVSAVVFFAVLRYMAPGLLGVPSDMQIVQLDEKVPPFYENIFRIEDMTSRDFILKDPMMRVRARPFFQEKPFLGPHDVLGFRNRSVPSVVDVITIGDSQTYGNNAFLEENWPSWMQKGIDERVSVYSMAVGGWGAPQYLSAFYMAAAFRPKAVVVAFYMGNDSVETFTMVRDVKEWGFLKPADGVEREALPEIVFPPPPDKIWHAEFSDGSKVAFTPDYRLSVNKDNKAIDAGYEMMADIARRISDDANKFGIKAFFTILPTKETVYLKKIREEGIKPPPDYDTLVHREEINAEKLAEEIRKLPGSVYIDVINPLQEAALLTNHLYPSGSDGHPLSGGYKVIGRIIADSVNKLDLRKKDGLVSLKVEDGYMAYLIRDEIAYFMRSDIFTKNGWSPDSAVQVSPREIAAFPKLELREVAPERFGPRN